jgi:hypothetical protein
MTTPRFTAEASLYRTHGHYRANRHAINSSAPMMSAIHPAEIIEVHGCAPGSEMIDWGDGTWSCETVGPDTSWGGGGDPGGSEYEGGEARPGKGGGKRPRNRRTPPGPKRRPPKFGRDCSPQDIPDGDVPRAEVECSAKAKDGDFRLLRCFDNPDGTVEKICCHMNSEGDMICITDIQRVP